MSGEDPPRTGGGRLLLALTALFLLLAGLGAWVLDRRAELARQRSALLGLYSTDVRAEAVAIDAGAPPPDAENAAVHYEAAFAKWRREGWHLVRKLDVPWETAPRDLVDYLAANAGALADAEKGAALERCRFAFPPSIPGGGLRDHCYGPPAQCEGMATSGWIDLFAIRARIHLEEGRTAAAAADALQVPRLVRHALPRTVRGAEEFDGTIRHAGEILDRVLHRPDLDAPTTRRVAAELLEWDRIAQDEATQRRIAALLHRQQLLSFLALGLPAEFEDRLRREFGLRERGLLPGLSEEDLEALSARRERWQGLRERAKAGAPPEGPPPPWMGKLTVLRAAFAVRARQLEKGAPPARLEDLVPDLLPEVPKDPWGTGPLRYEARGDAWSVESVGKVKVVARNPAGDDVWVPLDLRIEWPPKAQAPR